MHLKSRNIILVQIYHLFSSINYDICIKHSFILPQEKKTHTTQNTPSFHRVSPLLAPTATRCSGKSPPRCSGRVVGVVRFDAFFVLKKTPTYVYIWVFPTIGVPQNGWFVMKNHIKIDVWGGTLFLETPIYVYIYMTLKSQSFFGGREV